jgi:hypothetical protein
VTALRALLPRRAGPDLDAERRQRVTKVLALAEQFVYDLGLVIAGEQVDLSDYLEREPADRLRDAVRPALDAGAVISPDFGEYAQVRIQGDLLDRSIPLWAIVEFDDRSTRLDGISARAHGRRRVQVQLLLDSDIGRVLDHRIEVVS